jgi:serine/threonine-protein kinase/endoribonuclease IRE1
MDPHFYLFILIFALGWLAATVAETVNLKQDHFNLVAQRKVHHDFRFYPPAGAAEDSHDDLKLLDVVLLASVDGKFHALNRTSGRLLWSMTSSSTDAVPSILAPLVRTTHIDTDPELTDDENPNQDIYIIEPQSGEIYVSSSSPSSRLKRLPLTMSQLVDMSPFTFSDDVDTQIFFGKKETSLLLIDLETGKVKNAINSECPWDPFEDLHDNPNESDIDDLHELDGTSPSKTKPMEVYIGRTGS